MRRGASVGWVILGAIAAAVAAGCYGKSLGDVFDELSGEYRIPDYECWIRISGSHVTAVGADGETPCVAVETDDYDGEEFTYTQTLTVDGTISESHAEGTMVYVEIYSGVWSGCESIETLTSQLDLDVSRDEGLETSGRLSALAGSWGGSLDIVQTWAEELVAGDGCIEEPWSDSDEDASYYEIGADVEGDHAYIRYREGGDEWDAFYVDAPSDDELTIDGEDIEVR